MMSKGALFVVCAALALLQGCCGKPSEPEPEPESPSTIKTSIFQELSTYLDYALEHGEKLFMAVLADVAASEDADANEEIKRRSKIISDLLGRVDKLKKSTSNTIQDSWDSARDMGQTLEGFDVSGMARPTPEDRLFANYFEKHGFNDLDRDIRNKFKVILKSLDEKLHKFYDVVGSEVLDENPKWNEWRLKYEAETVGEKRLKLIVKFLLI